MHYTYVLWSKNDEKFYIGYTENLKRRLAEHKSGKNYTSTRLSGPELIFYEAFSAEADARRREAYFKTAKGKKSLRLILRDSLAGGVTVAPQTLDLLV